MKTLTSRTMRLRILFACVVAAASATAGDPLHHTLEATFSEQWQAPLISAYLVDSD